jgi:hypothetical protein
MKKQIVIDKTVYGGMLVEKYFLVLDNGIDLQVSYREWELYQKGDEYPKRLPDSFNQATNDTEEDKITNQDWKKLHDMQQRLVISLELEKIKMQENHDRLKEDLELYKKVNLDLRKELRMLEKLIELNMKDLWDIADQRDWYYEEYQKLKNRLTD